MSIRTFISVPLSDVVRDDLGRIREHISNCSDILPLKKGFKAVKPDNYHITLKFLGDVEEKEIPRIRETMQLAVRDIRPFDVTVHGFSGLPRIEKPRVVYIQVHDEHSRLADIYETLNTKLGYIKKEKRKYIPHITFIRIRRQKAWPGLASRLSGFLNRRFGVEQVSCIDLMASELNPSGPEYSRLERVPLGECCEI